MNFSIIQKSQLEGAMRLDAEYYQTKYLGLENNLRLTQTFKSWGEINGKFITGPFGSEFHVENYELNGKYRYVRGKDVKDFFLMDNDNVFIPEKDFERLKKYALQNHDVLISVVGTLGNASIIDESEMPAIFSCKSTVFRTNGINPYYFVAYLNSKYGKELLERSVRGAVQTGLNIDDLRSLLIFVPKNKIQENIANDVIEGKNQLNQSKKIYKQAEDMLLEKLELKDLNNEEKLFTIVNFSEARSANRIDAEYFQSKFEIINKKLSKQNLDQLANNFQVIRSKNFDYKEYGNVGVIKTKQLGKLYLNFKIESKTNEEIVKNDKLPLIKNGDVLFASMGVGSLGKTNMYYDFENNGKFTIDSTIKIFRQKENGKLMPEILTVFLNSRVGQELIYKNIVGSSGIISIYEEYLRNFKIPILPKEIQQKIADLVRQSHEAREKSKELLEEAKRKVEEMIEKGGEKG